MTFQTARMTGDGCGGDGYPQRMANGTGSSLGGLITPPDSIPFFHGGECNV